MVQVPDMLVELQVQVTVRDGVVKGQRLVVEVPDMLHQEEEVHTVVLVLITPVMVVSSMETHQTHPFNQVLEVAPLGRRWGSSRRSGRGGRCPTTISSAMLGLLSGAD